jgi:hypothetical protein
VKGPSASGNVGGRPLVAPATMLTGEPLAIS